jgi:DNA mismatch endonuclease (patch repair protein)
MVDRVSKEIRSKIMRAIRQKDTKPELLVRRLVTALGYRYRLHKKDLPGRPDLVFPGKKKVIFVHGCFWHVHEGCHLSHIPESEFWRHKLGANQERDRKTLLLLRELGWDVLILWECELQNEAASREKLLGFLCSLTEKP